MEKGNEEIEIFDLVDTIRYQHGISLKEWAKASGFSNQSRLSEWRRMVKADKTGKKLHIDRRLQIVDCLSLFTGLINLVVWDDVFSEEINKIFQKIKSQDIRLMFMARALRSKEEKDKAAMFIQKLLKDSAKYIREEDKQILRKIDSLRRKGIDIKGILDRLDPAEKTGCIFPIKENLDS